ncbi:MAG: hypothetical protein DYG95_18520, partial [Chlorobi bacterium CHB1]|nr:hypothetical protein [Chlorobi bacterium CHB1]
FFHWELEFPEVFYEKGGKKDNSGFDVVVGNPPYRDLKELNSELVSILFIFFTSTQNRANVYASFVERSFQLLRRKGEFGMIVPNSWLTQSSYSKLKEVIFSKTHLHHIVRIPETAFSEQKVETTIVCALLDNPTSDAQTTFIGYTDNMTVEVIDANKAPFSGVKQQSAVAKESGTLWSVHNVGNNLLSKIDVMSSHLADICDFSLGLTPYDKYKGHTEQQISNQVFHANHKKDNSFKPLLTGGDISRYTVEWSGKEWISYGDWLGAPRERRFFTMPRILVKQIIDWTSRRIHAGYTDEELYNAQIAFNLVPISDESPLFILAVLNSNLLNYYHRRRFLDTAKVRFQKVLIQDAKNFPIRKILFTTPPERRNALADKGRKLYERCLSEKSYQCVLEFVAHHLGQQPEESDVVHDLLALLAEEMIRLNKDKQAESKRFLSWLQKKVRLAEGIDSLSGKTTIKNYLGDYQKNEPETPFAEILEVAIVEGRGK